MLFPEVLTTKEPSPAAPTARAQPCSSKRDSRSSVEGQGALGLVLLWDTGNPGEQIPLALAKGLIPALTGQEQSWCHSRGTQWQEQPERQGEASPAGVPAAGCAQGWDKAWHGHRQAGDGMEGTALGPGQTPGMQKSSEPPAWGWQGSTGSSFIPNHFFGDRRLFSSTGWTGGKREGGKISGAVKQHGTFMTGGSKSRSQDVISPSWLYLLSTHSLCPPAASQ